MSSQHERTNRRSPRSAPIEERWDRYLLTRGTRAHGDLLRATDGYVRAQARRRLGGRHPLYEEVVQEALVGVARRIATGERPDRPAAYVAKIVNNKVADLLERETRRQAREEQQWAPEVEPIEASVDAEWHDFLATMRTIVSADEFWTLILRYHFDYSYGEIGQLLDKEPNAIRQIAFRGRRKCRERMSRVEGRIPAWLFWPDADPTDQATIEDPGTAGAGPGPREPRETDPDGWSRRPAAGSDSEAGPVAPPIPVTRARPAAVPIVGRGPVGSPMTILPLVVLLSVPVLLALDRSSSGSVRAVPADERTAVSIESRELPPAAPTVTVSGATIPTTTVTKPSTAPTAQSEAPSNSASPTTSEPGISTPDPVVSSPTPATGSDPPTVPPTTELSTTAPPTTVSSITVSSITVSSITVSSTTVSRPTTTRPPTTARVTTTRTTRPTTTSTSTSTTTTTSITTTSITTTSITTTSTTTTLITTTSTTAPSSTTTATSGRSTTSTTGDDPPIDQ